MSELCFYIIPPKDVPKEIKEEIEKFPGIWFVTGIPFMFEKGLKYIPTIISLACGMNVTEEVRYSAGDDDDEFEISEEQAKIIEETFKELKQKVKVRKRKDLEGGWEYRINWPSDVLDLKEVQEEAKKLANSNEVIISKDNPKDIAIIRGMLERRWTNEMASIEYWVRERPEIVAEEAKQRLLLKDDKQAKEKYIEENTDLEIESENNSLKEWGEYFLKALELHKKYPKVRFWFIVTGPS
ncbi:MAG: hypothetical protein HA495_04325 [Thaumarchaeota archaeon]|nr:hypothetical protein [Nitrososphaerota archaeon]